MNDDNTIGSNPSYWQEIAAQISNKFKGRKTGSGYQVHCPCHKDEKASLSITPLADDLLWHCKAGCSQDAIKEVLIHYQLYPNKKKKWKSTIAPVEAEIYTYRDADGKYLYEKVRYYPKDFRMRRSGSFKEPTKGLPRVLYLLPELIKAIERDDVILLCEGEKDVKNFLKLKIPGYFATTNFEGAAKWCREYTKQLEGARVVICEDNDDAGRERTLRVGEELNRKCAVKIMRFEQFGPKGDLSDFLEIGGQTNKDVIATIEISVQFVLEDLIKKTQAPESSQELESSGLSETTNIATTSDGEEITEGPRKKKVPDATLEDYFRLYEKVLGPLPRDIFTGECMCEYDGLWIPAANELDRVKSRAEYLRTSKIRNYQYQAIDWHFAEYEHKKERVLIPKFPDWDGRDRIQEIVNCIKLVSNGEFERYMLSCFIKGWLVGVFKKLYDPSYRNRVLVFSGPQHIGKDWMIEAIVGGFGQWVKDLQLTYNDRDNYLQLSSAAVLRVAEIERTNKHDHATLKDMYTRGFTNLRASHDRRAIDRQCRASFIASCNTDDIYRDPTGHTRYAVFNLENIKWEYPRSENDKLQVLAQGIHLLQKGYEIPPMAMDAMNNFLASKTPESFADYILDEWQIELEHWFKKTFDTLERDEIIKREWMTNAEIRNFELFEKIAKRTGSSVRIIRQQLTSKNMAVRTENSRGYKCQITSVSRHIECQDENIVKSDDYII